MSRFFTSVRILCNRFMVAVALIFGLCVGNSFGTIYSYDLRGGDLPSNVESIESESEEGYITVANPVNTGYEFIGWCADSDFDDNNNNSGSNPDYSDDTCNGTLEDPDWRIPATLDNNAQSRTYYAFWEQTYPIDYNLGNGETNHVDNPNTFKIGDLSITLGNPTSSGYMFMGWCASDMSGGLCSAANTVTQIKVCSTDSTKFCSDNDVEIGSTSAGVSVYPTWVADTTYNSCSDGERATFEINASTGVVTSGCTACPAGYDCQAGTTYRLSNSTYDEDSGKYVANVTDLCTDGYYSVAGGACTVCPDSMNSTTNRTSCVCTGSNEIFHPALGQCVALDNINPGEVTQVIFNADGSVYQINQRTQCPLGSYCTGASNIVASSVLPSDINNLNGFDCFRDTSNGKVFCYIGRTECTGNKSTIGREGYSSADACVDCPSGSTPSAHHETCVCNNSNEILYRYMDVQTTQSEWKCAVTATSMPGRYLDIDPVDDLFGKKQYILGWANTWCDAGSYCPGGEYGYGQCNNGNGIDLTDLSGFDDCDVGRYSCGGYSSVDGATSLADCRACPAGSKTVKYGCECEANDEVFDRQSWSCVPQSSKCPSLKNNMLYYGDDGLLYAMDRAWDPEAQKCVAYWLTVDTKSDIYPTYAACVAQGNDEYDCFGQLVTQYPNELVNAGANLMLCEQSSERDSKDEAEYFGGCTVAAKLCDINDINSLFSVIDDGNKIINFVKSLLPANDNGYSAERMVQGTPDMTCVQNLMVEHANDDPAYTVEQATEHCMNLDIPNWVNDYRCPAPDPEATPVVCPSVFIDLDEDGNIDYDDPTRNFGQWLSLDGEAFTDINNDGVTDVSDCVNGYYYGVFWPGIVAGYGSMVQSLVTKATEQGAANPVSFMANMTGIALNNPNNAFGSMVFCQYDNDPESSGYGTYTKNCSKPISICGLQHLMENQAIMALLPDLDNVRGAMGVTALLSGSGVDIYDPDWKKKLFTSGAGTNLQSRANNFTIADSTCQNYCAAGYTYDIVDEDNDGRVDSVNNMPAYACTQTTYTCDAGQYLGLNTNTGALECAACLPGYSCANADWTTGKGVNDLDLSGENGIPWGTYGLSPVVCSNGTRELVVDQDGGGYISNGVGLSVGNTTDECSYMRVYFDDVDDMAFDAEEYAAWEADPTDPDNVPSMSMFEADYSNGGIKIAFCNGNYCTKAYKICSTNDMMALAALIGDAKTMDLYAKLLAALAKVSDYNDTSALTALFDQDANDVEEFDRCFKYGACGAGEYLTGEDNLGNKTTQCAPCEAGYYCPGVDLGENWHAGDEFITGKESCPAGTFGPYPGADSEDACLSCRTSTSGLYPSSDAASTSLVQCYATCSGDPDCGNLKHVGTCAYTTGRKYNDGFGICDANVTACDAEHYTPTPVNTLSDNDLPKIGTQGLCNDVPSNDTGEHRFAQNSTGVQCWVRVISIDEMDIDSAWVHSAQYESKEQCASLCGIGNITSSVWSDLMDTISNKNACMPDTININWNGVANSGDAATCTWDGKLTVPNVKPTLTGYTFVGWRHAVTPSAAP